MNKLLQKLKEIGYILKVLKGIWQITANVERLDKYYIYSNRKTKKKVKNEKKTDNKVHQDGLNSSLGCWGREEARNLPRVNFYQRWHERELSSPLAEHNPRKETRKAFCRIRNNMRQKRQNQNAYNDLFLPLLLLITFELHAPKGYCVL